MNALRKLLFCLCLFISCQGKSQNRLNINIPTAEAETEYIWSTIQDINFLEANRYQVSLPSGELIETLKIKAREGNL